MSTASALSTDPTHSGIRSLSRPRRRDDTPATTLDGHGSRCVRRPRHRQGERATRWSLDDGKDDVNCPSDDMFDTVSTW